MARFMKNSTRYFISVLALVDILVKINWIFLFAFLVHDRHRVSAGIIGYCLAGSFVINFGLWRYLFKVFGLSRDPSFAQYAQKIPAGLPCYTLPVIPGILPSLQAYLCQDIGQAVIFCPILKPPDSLHHHGQLDNFESHCHLLACSMCQHLQHVLCKLFSTSLLPGHRQLDLGHLRLLTFWHRRPFKGKICDAPY